MLTQMEQEMNQADVPEEIVRCGPDEILTTNFGSISKRSIPFRLCTSNEQAYALADGSGDYRFMRDFKEVTNSEMYKYLRMGVSSQNVMAYKALGYMTPESLQESPEVSALLPDVLAREDREYPLDFIDLCEKEEISALDCQMVLRRGITTQHLAGSMDARQLMNLFRRYVPREGVSLASNNQKSIIDYFVDGTLPVALQDGEFLRPEHVIATVRHCLREDAGFLEELKADLPMFRKFVQRLVLGHKNGVGRLRALVANHGPVVLELRDPYFCSVMVHEDDGSSHRIGYEVAAYVEEVVFEELGPYRTRHSNNKGNEVYFDGRGIPVIDFEKMLLAGITVPELRQYVLADGLSPQSVIAGREDAIINPLMAGSL